MTTKYKIAEQVMNLVNGGRTKAATEVQIEDVMEVIQQTINTLYKQDHLSVNMANGETIPESLMLTTYDNGGVGYAPVSYKGVSKVTLPVMPITLPRNLGVYEISYIGDYNNPFIPLQAGQQALLRTEKLINTLLNQVAYEVNGSIVVFNQDITTSTKNVMFKLVTMDFSAYDEYTMIPLSSDMESDVVQAAFKLFSAQMPSVKVDDPANLLKVDNK